MERMLMEYWANSIWQIPFIAVGAWLLLRIGRPRPTVQHRVWLGALTLAVMMPLCGMSYPRDAAVTVSIVADEASDTAPGQFERVDSRGWLERSLREHQVSLSPQVTATLVSLYLAAIGFGLSRLLLSLWAARRMVQGARPALLREVELDALARCCERLKVRQPRVLVSSRTVSPVVVGVMRPVLILPQDFRRSSTSELEAVWWHELAHVCRRDYLANLLCRIVSLPVAYHPAAYAISQRVRRTREMVCDAMAANQMESPVRYAQCLVELARRMQAGQGMEAQGIGMFDDGVLEERVMELIETKAAVSVRTKAVRLAGGVAAMLMMVTTAAMFHVTPTLAAMAPAESAVTEPADVIAATTGSLIQPSAPTMSVVPSSRAEQLRMEKRLAGVKQQAGETQEVASLELSADAAIAADEPAKVASGVMAGNLLTHASPVYPADAKAQHISGSVVLHALISKTGNIEDLTVISGPDELRASAMDAVKQWTYRPYLLNGEPTAVETTITVHYSLNGQLPMPGSGPALISSGVIAGNILTKVNPVYPADAKVQHISGPVVLHALIGKDGTIKDLQVISGPKELTMRAIDAVKQWTYKPYILNGNPTEVETTITVNYNLSAPLPPPQQ
jgi:TonB family protein